MFAQLQEIAIEMDKAHGGNDYQSVCQTLSSSIDNPELTISGRLLNKIRHASGIGKVGCQLGEQYRDELLAHQLPSL